MDKNTVDLITGLAWPFVVLVAIGVFGDAIKAGIETITIKLKSITSLKVGSVEAITQETEKVTAEATISVLKSKHPSSTDNLLLIESAFHDIETKVDAIMTKSGKSSNDTDFETKVRTLETSQILTAMEARALRGLHVLKMLATSGPRIDVTDEKAKEFIGIAAANNYFLSIKT